MQHDDRVYLRHMLDMAKKAQELAGKKSREEFERDEVLRLALRHLLQIVGEAASRLPRDFRAGNPDIPWDEIVGMRHRVVHDYLGIDDEVVWTTVVQDLPSLVELLERKLDG
jgi:uncharacterized protein with HEPN domain